MGTARARRRGPWSAVVSFAVSLALACGGLVALAGAGHAATIGSGADLPYVEQQAEDAATNGTVIGPDRTYTKLPSEASGRRAVTLDAKGQYVEFTLTKPANSLVLRYSIPDSADGSGQDAPLALYVGGSKAKDLTLTSRYSWYYGSYPYSNNPGDGTPHHFYDEVHTLLPDMAVGTKVRLQVDTDNPVPYTLDLADFEQVAAAATQPAGSVSVTDHGADPTGQKDSSDAFDAAIAAAKASGAEVWIPEGTFLVTRHIIVDGVTVRGAGPWRSTVTGKGVGFYGKDAADGGSKDVHLADFAIFGDTTERVDSDQVNGVGGALGDSTIDNLWIEHTKVGIWLDGPFDNLKITNVRLRDLTADGVNFHTGITNSSVTNSEVRNTGDDGLATWSEKTADADDTFANDTVDLPMLANGIAVYGGRDISVTDNLVRDTITSGGGIHVGNRFSAVPLAGTITLARNRTERAGDLDLNWQFGVGAVWFYALDSAMDGTIKVSDTEIDDSSYEALQFIGSGISNVSFDDVKLAGAGTFALQLQSSGSASFTGVTASDIGKAGIYDCQGEGAFTVTKDSTSTGWDDTYCGPWPDPVYPTAHLATTTRHSGAAPHAHTGRTASRPGAGAGHAA